jgi:hypothetical protein
MKFKKFIWCGIAAVAIGGFATFNASLNSQSGLSTVVKTNLEALSYEAKENEPCYAGENNSSLPVALACRDNCKHFEPVNTNIQKCRL